VGLDTVGIERARRLDTVAHRGEPRSAPRREKLVRRPLLHSPTALALVLATCAAPYTVATGPVPPCDNGCGPEMAEYRALLADMGYVATDLPAGTVGQSHYWTRTNADTIEAITVRFDVVVTGGGGPAANSARYQQISVSGQTLVDSAGHQRRIEDSPSLRPDVDRVAKALREIMKRAQPGG
jgi:hypothetical protein